MSKLDGKIWQGVALTCLVLCVACSGSTSAEASNVGSAAIRGTSFGPVVAGSFYPGDPDELDKMIEGFLKRARPVVPKGRLIGFVSPHAGYMYSGPVAAWGFAMLRGRRYDRVVIMAPSHRMYSDHIGVLDADYYSIPTGRVKIDRKACDRLVRDSSLFAKDEKLFSREHAMEVELPFLRKVLPDVPVVPLVFGNPSLKTARTAANVLIELFKGTRTLFIASSDLSHYHPYEHAVKEDKGTLELIAALDVETLATMRENRERELCGFGPVATLMAITKSLAGTANVVHYANSGDTAGGKDRVVGYGVVAFILKE